MYRKCKIYEHALSAERLVYPIEHIISTGLYPTNPYPPLSVRWRLSPSRQIHARAVVVGI